MRAVPVLALDFIHLVMDLEIGVGDKRHLARRAQADLSPDLDAPSLGKILQNVGQLLRHRCFLLLHLLLLYNQLRLMVVPLATIDLRH